MTPLQTTRSVLLGLLLLLLTSYPIMAVFNRPDTWHGIPVLYLYVFAIWLLLVLMLMVNAAIQSPKAES